MTTRKDKHSPKSFDPAKYAYQGTVILKFEMPSFGVDDRELEQMIEAWQNAIADLDKRVRSGGHHGNYLKKGSCDHCGAYFHYGAEFKHESGEVIVVGHTCAVEAFGHDSRRAYDLKRAQKRAKALRERLARIAAANQFLEANDLGEVFSKERVSHDSREGRILWDLRAKLFQWGSLSEKQIAFARRLADDVGKPAQPPVCDFCNDEGHKAKDCPNRGEVPVTSKRIEVRAWVVSTRAEDDHYGGTSTKALYQLPDGCRLWGTVPRAILDVLYWEEHKSLDDLRGRYVSFVAGVKRSDKDPSFGFIKRPASAQFIEAFENAPVRR